MLNNVEIESVRMHDFVISARLPDGARLKIGVETKPKKITLEDVPSYVMDPSKAAHAGVFEGSSWEGGNENYIYRRDAAGQWTRSVLRFA